MAEAVCGSSASMGLHFPQEQLTWITPIFARLISSVPRFRGCRHFAPLQARNLAKTIARDKPVSTLNVLANIMKTGIIKQTIIMH
jgi:hypothetical protein